MVRKITGSNAGENDFLTGDVEPRPGDTVQVT
jgi:hypothetical protein